ncbi:LOW QUALITY PROTEIN: hypothetical protein JCM18903_54 [Psychrobacter sp. JCM 18903]|nr:LOW QUALITY PROTEIN: hypothetical protein JCM18903_54 [Psychrobacter sp. JCM 18903]
MAKFLNSSGTTYHLEELIKNASDRLIIISTYLKLNERIKELLEDRNRLKIDIRIVYGKNDLHPEEINWLKNLTFIRTSFCKNLHAKCYLNENECIITSLNLYEFSQVNNNEMGVLIYRNEDAKLYADTYEEAQRIIRISDEVRMSLEKVTESDGRTDNTATASYTMPSNNANTTVAPTATEAATLITLNRRRNLPKSWVLRPKSMISYLQRGYLQEQEGELTLTDAGRAAGGTSKKGKFGDFCLWDSGMVI